MPGTSGQASWLAPSPKVEGGTHGGSAKVAIPVEKLTGLDKCGGEGTPVAKVTNTTLNGTPFEMQVAAAK